MTLPARYSPSSSRTRSLANPQVNDRSRPSAADNLNRIDHVCAVGPLRKLPLKSHAYGIANDRSKLIADCQAEDIGTFKRMTGVEQFPG